MASLTPMMRQYVELKEKYNDCLLLFRLGDFYEMFFEDAVTGSKELELTLTGKDCGLDERAPMCGVPYHSVNSYINRLIDKGYKVAICEQLTDPALSQGLVERDVIRVITPGTVIEEQMLNDKENNFIAAVYSKGDDYFLSYCDVSTGDFYVLSIDGRNGETELVNEIVRINPRQIITNMSFTDKGQALKNVTNKIYVEQLDERSFDAAAGQSELIKHFKVATLEGFGLRDKSPEVCAAGALLAYLEDTQKNSLMHIDKITKLYRSEYMRIDAATRRNLEIFEPLRFDGSKKNTLLYILDKTETAMGGRMLHTWLAEPLQSEEKINLRLDAVEKLFYAVKEREQLKAVLSKIYDVERLCSKIAYSTINPKDCIALRDTLAYLPELCRITGTFKSERTDKIAESIDLMDDVYKMLLATIQDDAPVSAKDGGIIRKGYNKTIDELRELSDNGAKWIKDYENAERERTGIKNLKIGYNRVFGYYIEVSKSNIENVPLDYNRKQTLTNAERYVTPGLKETEEKILTAKDKCLALEYTLFCGIREVLQGCTERLKQDSLLIAELDCYYSLAKAAAANNYVRPKLNNKGKISIIDGRHPVVENGMKGGFVPNSCETDTGSNRVIILTGPNMAGKSTYMRQIALITLMAHIGSFVPAKSANICITDRIFTRVGASDSLSTGQSTFMVEMTEMANILNSATDRSFIIIDEIGRGTSTFDGLSIAWAVVEYIADKHKCGAKTLFATHYHELTELEGKLDGVKNYRITVKEIGDDIIFLRKVVRGEADKSFGIQVAKLAGLPNSLIERAKAILEQIEASDISRAASRVKKQPENTQVSISGAENSDEIIDELVKIDPYKITPMQALSKLYELSTKAKLIK